MRFYAVRSIFFSLLLAFPTLSPAMSLSYYLEERANKFVEAYVMGLGQGVFSTSVAFGAERQSKLFCLPPKLAITNNLVKSLLDQEIDKPVDGRPYAQETPIELIMVKSFIGRFPCGG